MWERLKQSDIAEAKRDLRLRVDETLRRHVEELKGLDSDLAEVETLNRLVDAFSEKFGTAPASAAPGKAADAPTNSTAERGSARSRQSDPEAGQRGGPRTNFDAFSRAVAKNDRW